MINIKNIHKTYQTGDITTHVLKGIDLSISEGEFVSIMGPSGSGKSTLMHIVSFLDSPSEGIYTFKGQDVSTLSDDELAKMRNENIGFIFQSFNLLPRATVYENVELPLLYANHPYTKKDILDAIEDVGLGHRTNNLSNQLSGGERQRVAIARALINNPDIIFADEPTGNLDSKSGNHVLKILQDLNEKGNTIVMVTHEQDTADHAKRIVYLKDGVLLRDEPVTTRRIAKEGVLRK